MGSSVALSAPALACIFATLICFPCRMAAAALSGNSAACREIQHVQKSALKSASCVTAVAAACVWFISCAGSVQSVCAGHLRAPDTERPQCIRPGRHRLVGRYGGGGGRALGLDGRVRCSITQKPTSGDVNDYVGNIRGRVTADVTIQTAIVPTAGCPR